MSKRRDIEGKFARRRSPGFIAASWIASCLSLGILYAAGLAVSSDFAQFRSCNTNDGLSLHSCGKQSINVGDLVLIILFILAAVLVVTLFTASWRMVSGNRRGKA